MTCQSANDVPQPQELVAFGLVILKDCPIRSSTKSIVLPASRSSEVSSISTVAPSRSMTMSPGAFSRSTSKTYWKPEQPRRRR